MQQRILNWCLLFLAMAALCGCERLPGKPREEDRWRPPNQIKDFAVLYSTNCLACHGDEKTLGPAVAMSNPVYLSIAPKDVMRKAIAEGIPGTMMPGYSAAVGGMLTDEQINILVDGIHNWSAGHPPAGSNQLPYAAPSGDKERGATVYAQDCEQCHGKDGTGGKFGSVVDPAYLSLVSDQYLRTIIIAGRPELGMPNYQEYVPGKPMTAEEVADLVAWLSSHREGTAPGAAPGETGEGNQPSPPTQQ
jgi:cytochrome c oxidase cbb3-type subunit 3